MQNELWRSVDGYEGLYEVSNLGRIRSLDRIDAAGRQLKGTILKPGTNGGYLRVMLSKEEKKKSFYVHRVVGQAFIPNPKNLPDINHKDENKTNNRVENLEWCDRKYNINYGCHNERVAKALLNHPNFSKPVSQYSLDGKFVKTYPSVSEAARQMKMKTYKSISNCLTGRRKTAHGYVWRYADSDL